MAGQAMLDADEIKLHRGGSGPNLLLLHCLGVDRHLWDIAAKGLDRHFTLLTYDLPGHGETALPAGAYGVEQLSRQLAAVLQREGVKRTHVAGISLGGLIAQHFAAHYPDMVDRLALIDTTPRYVDEMRKMWVERAATARSAGTRALVDGLLQIWFTPDFIAKNPPAARYVRETISRTSGEGYALACEALGAADLRSLVKDIKAKTLVICGENDVPPFLAAARWLAAELPQAQLTWLAPARHASVLEQPEAFRQALQGFLA